MGTVSVETSVQDRNVSDFNTSASIDCDYGIWIMIIFSMQSGPIFSGIRWYSSQLLRDYPRFPRSLEKL